MLETSLTDVTDVLFLDMLFSVSLAVMNTV